MSSLVLLVGQLAIGLGSFIGVAKALDWYHADKKGGVKNDNSKRKLHN